MDAFNLEDATNEDTMLVYDVYNDVSVPTYPSSIRDATRTRDSKQFLVESNVTTSE
jgi:hypothetical protein